MKQSMKRMQEHLIWNFGVTDLSSTGRTGAAVVWKKNRNSEEWQELNTSLGQNKEIFDAEMWGISEAVKVAEQKTRQVQQPLVIGRFSDNHQQLERVSQFRRPRIKSADLPKSIAVSPTRA